jgi:Zn-dependent protease with chaperone function
MKTLARGVETGARPKGPQTKEFLLSSHHNGLKTAALLGLLTALILAVGYWLGGSAGLVFAVVLSLGMNAYSYFYSDKLALRAMRARPVSEAEFPALYQMVRELSTEARQPMPRLYVSPSMQPERVRDRPQPAARRRGGDRRASPSCSTGASCAA